MADLEIQHDQPLSPDLPPQWKFWQQVLSPAAQAVYLSLRRHPDSLLDPTLLAQSLGLTERQLATALQELESHGFISLPPPPAADVEPGKRRRQDPP